MYRPIWRSRILWAKSKNSIKIADIFYFVCVCKMMQLVACTPACTPGTFKGHCVLLCWLKTWQNVVDQHQRMTCLRQHRQRKLHTETRAAWILHLWEMNFLLSFKGLVTDTASNAMYNRQINLYFTILGFSPWTWNSKWLVDSRQTNTKKERGRETKKGGLEGQWAIQRH